MRKFGPVVAWLACAAPAFAEAPPKQKEVWITIGTDALEPVRASFKEKGLTLPKPAMEKGGVAVLRVPESRLETLSEAMHDKLNRCAGFLAHDTEAEARAAAEGTSTSASQSLASLVGYSLNNSASVNVMLAQVEELNIRNTINSLSTNWTSRRYNQQSGTDAATWLKNEWTTIANGRSDVQVAFFTHASSVSPQPSVIATIIGTTHPNEVVVIGGHLDSINQSGSTAAAPGADDDASGVASLTEAFRVAMANGYQPARTVKFMAYAAEEVGLKGSADIAAWHVTNGVNVVGVLQLDMTNYKGSSYDFAMVTDNTNAAQNSFVTSLISTYQPGLTYTNISCGYGCSDHASWHSRGFAASMPFEATMSTSNPQIHTTGDTLTFMGGTAANSVKFSKLAVSFLGELAKGATTGNTPPPVDDGTPPPTCTPVTLSNGVTVSGISVATGEWSCAYTLEVPSGASNLTFDLSGGTGDADMHVKFGAEPTSSSYDCRPYKSGNVETCTFATPSAGTYYVKLNGYSAASGMSLKGAYSTGGGGGGGGTLTNGVESAQYSGARSAWTCNTLVVPAGKTSVVFNQTGKTGTTGDADLYVKFGSAPTTSSYNCRPYLSGSTESCTISNPGAGTWYACSYGYSAYTNVTMKGTY
ncbi:M20/M25/M40 family metallo-hydrolase [Archangium lansingense]|uniref:M20/M25/M40 family metallo-hydrolase n=1 Tax=Archangium lansingense TaxID=2995310 RepID=UPI003B807E02